MKGQGQFGETARLTCLVILMVAIMALLFELALDAIDAEMVSRGEQSQEAVRLAALVGAINE
ncbi:MAG TPA: hypothetical protein VI298_08590 [Geobacteraceae bacterium]